MEAKLNYETPTLFNISSFLGLPSYYRCFIKDFASIARPLTDIPKSENEKINDSQSKRLKINLNE